MRGMLLDQIAPRRTQPSHDDDGLSCHKAQKTGAIGLQQVNCKHTAKCARLSQILGTMTGMPRRADGPNEGQSGIGRLGWIKPKGLLKRVDGKGWIGHAPSHKTLNHSVGRLVRVWTKSCHCVPKGPLSAKGRGRDGKALPAKRSHHVKEATGVNWFPPCPREQRTGTRAGQGGRPLQTLWERCKVLGWRNITMFGAGQYGNVLAGITA